jgi:predicted glutamine amidotransferase
MSFCFGFMSNDHMLTGCALTAFKPQLTLDEGAPNGWGMGYFQAGQPLLRKQPKAPPGPLTIAETAGKLKTNLILGHVRDATVGSQRTENTHPFRYRNWIFCHSGTLDRFEQVKTDMLRSVPDFIRRNIRGKTDSEHLFHLFLSFLNDTGQMDDPRIRPEIAARALGSTFAYVDRLIEDHGGEVSDDCCLVSNGAVLLGIRRGTVMKVARQSSYTCPDSDGKMKAAPNLKAVILVGGRDHDSPGWEEVADRSIVTVDGALNIEYSTSR